MELFEKAKTIRLRSHNDKYLVAEEDHETISQGNERSAQNATWTVEFVEGKGNFICLKSCYGTYLTASNVPFLPKVTAKKVVQTPPSHCDPVTQWEPLRDGMQVRLRSFWGNFLRPHGGLSPWKNSVTHENSYWNMNQEKVLWNVEVVEKRTCIPRSCSKLCRSMSLSTSMSSYREKLIQNQI